MIKYFKSKSAMAASLAVLAVATPFVAYEEGLRTKAYLDVVGIPTICHGETEGVKMGDTKTVPECNAMLYAKLGATSTLVDHLIEVPMTVNAHAAFTSWVYNVGPNAARKSTLVKIANTGNIRGACEQLLRWKYAGGKPILLGRRMRELKLCLTGL